MTDTGIEIGFGVELGVRIGDLGTEVNRLRREIRHLRDMPVSARIGASQIADANGNASIVIGGPAVGRQWEVRGIRIGGVDPTVSVAGKGYVYIGGGALTVTTLDWIDEATSLPLPATYGAGEVLLHERELLYVRIVGGTSGLPYVATASVTDYDLERLRAEEAL
jgi:hypothetical protein